MKVQLLFFLIVLSFSAESLDSTTWTLVSSAETAFSSFLNQTSGPCSTYFIMVNDSIKITMQNKNENPIRSMTLIIIPLQGQDDDINMPIKAAINVYYNQTDNEKIFNELIESNISLIPYEKLTIATVHGTFEVQFQENTFLFIIILFDSYVLSIFGLGFIWYFRIAKNYLGFQIINYCVRIWLKQMLFGELNGQNYYFKSSQKGYWLLLYIILVIIDLYGLLHLVPKLPSKKDKIIMIGFYLLAFIPLSVFQIGLFICIIYQSLYIYRRTKKLKLYTEVCYSYLSLIWLNALFLNLYIFCPYILFPPRFRSNALFAVNILQLLECFLYSLHLKFNPFLPYIVIYYSCLKMIYFKLTRFPIICQKCNQEQTNCNALFEHYLIQRQYDLQWQTIICTPCKHYFHIKCMRETLEASRLCPVEGGIISNDWIKDNFGDVGAPEIMEVEMVHPHPVDVIYPAGVPPLDP